MGACADGLLTSLRRHRGGLAGFRRDVGELRAATVRAGRDVDRLQFVGIVRCLIAEDRATLTEMMNSRVVRFYTLLLGASGSIADIGTRWGMTGVCALRGARTHHRDRTQRGSRSSTVASGRGFGVFRRYARPGVRDARRLCGRRLDLRLDRRLQRPHRPVAGPKRQRKRRFPDHSTAGLIRAAFMTCRAVKACIRNGKDSGIAAVVGTMGEQPVYPPVAGIAGGYAGGG